MNALKPIYICQLFTDFRLVSKNTEFEPSQRFIDVIIPRYHCQMQTTDVPYPGRHLSLPQSSQGDHNNAN